MKQVLLALAGLMLVTGSSVDAANPPTTWDGLVKVPSKRFDMVYLQPGANFGSYTKVMMEPTEVAFHKNWRRDYNNTTRDLSSKVSDQEVQNAISKGVTAATDIFSEAWTKGGYAVVTDPGPDVLRVKVGIVNIQVNAPERMTAVRSHGFASEAGSAVLFVEARDSMTGALLGRAIDQSTAGENSAAWRTTVSNRADFRDLVHKWADISVRGISALKSQSPVAP